MDAPCLLKAYVSILWKGKWQEWSRSCVRGVNVLKHVFGPDENIIGGESLEWDKGVYEGDGKTDLGVGEDGENAALEWDAGATRTSDGPAESCMRTMESLIRIEKNQDVFVVATCETQTTGIKGGTTGVVWLQWLNLEARLENIKTNLQEWLENRYINLKEQLEKPWLQTGTCSAYGTSPAADTRHKNV